MRWITRKSLESEFGISWAVAEAIIRKECNAVREGKGRGSRGYPVLWFGCFLGAMVYGRWLFPSAHGARLALVELPGLVLLTALLLVIPRLLAAPAILAAAEKSRGDRAMIGASKDGAATSSPGADHG